MNNLHFFSLRPDFGSPTIGWRESLPPGFAWDAPNAQAKLQKYSFPDFEPVFSDVILRETSELTDFIADGSIGGFGYIVSIKLKEILDKYKLTAHRYYPLTVVWRGKRIQNQYYWLQLLEVDNYHWIDFPNSSFVINPNDFVSPVYDIRISSMEDLYLLKKKLPVGQQVSFRYLTFTDQYYNDTPVDLFLYKKIANFPIITEPLKQELEQAGIRTLYDWFKIDIRSKALATEPRPVSEAQTKLDAATITFDEKPAQPIRNLYRDFFVHTTIVCEMQDEWLINRSLETADQYPSPLNTEELSNSFKVDNSFFEGYPQYYELSYMSFVHIDKIGNVIEFKFLVADNGLILDQVRECIKKIKFKPAMKQNQPVDSYSMVEFLFKLQPI